MENWILLYCVDYNLFSFNVSRLLQLLGKFGQSADWLSNLLGKHPNYNRNKSEEKDAAAKYKQNQVDLVLVLSSVQLV